MPAFLDTLRSWAEWGDDLLGGNCSGAGRRRVCLKFCDTCAPSYVATDDEDLEFRRLDLGCALACQLAAVSCMLVTGHLSGGAIGLAIFVVGNRARCSLEFTTSSSFAAAGFTFGVFDLGALAQHIAASPATFVLLPVQANLAHDLTAIAMVLAPTAKLLAARIALDTSSLACARKRQAKQVMLYGEQLQHPLQQHHFFYLSQQHRQLHFVRQAQQAGDTVVVDQRHLCRSSLYVQPASLSPLQRAPSEFAGNGASISSSGDWAQHSSRKAAWYPDDGLKGAEELQEPAPVGADSPGASAGGGLAAVAASAIQWLSSSMSISGVGGGGGGMRGSETPPPLKKASQQETPEKSIYATVPLLPCSSKLDGAKDGDPTLGAPRDVAADAAAGRRPNAHEPEPETEEEKVACAECGATVEGGDMGRIYRGTGCYSDSVYCDACWKVWRANPGTLLQ